MKLEKEWNLSYMIDIIKKDIFKSRCPESAFKNPEEVAHTLGKFIKYRTYKMIDYVLFQTIIIAVLMLFIDSGFWVNLAFTLCVLDSVIRFYALKKFRDNLNKANFSTDKLKDNIHQPDLIIDKEEFNKLIQMKLMNDGNDKEKLVFIVPCINTITQSKTKASIELKFKRTFLSSLFLRGIFTRGIRYGKQ